MKEITRQLHVGLVLFVSFAILSVALAQPADANYDESKVPKYVLPDPLVLGNGKPVTDARTWNEVRRPEILKLFETHVYGRSPAGRPAKMHFELMSVDRGALGGKATRKEVRIHFAEGKNGPKMDLLIYQPNNAKKPFPAFVGLNFNGNHTVHADPGITLAEVWNRPAKGQPAVRSKADAKTRGQNSGRWDLDQILGRGYALATAYYGDITPDAAESLHLGVHQLYAKDQKEPAPEGWGAIGAWGWGLSRALDYIETDSELDARRVAVMGHSRLGKTALWAGAQDERFAIVISNNSGCGGAALSKRRFGETVHRINTSFPHWFCGNFKKYDNNEDALPVDQHMLVALMAPRPVYVASAQEDLWADPRGEFLAAKLAEPVYQLLGTDGLGANDMPSVDQPVMGRIGYHIRTGKHDVTSYDWKQYLAFADKHFSRTQTAQTSTEKQGASGEWRSLFDGKSLAGWKITDFGGSGEVAVKDGQILLPMGVILTGVTWTNESVLPKTNYEIALDAMKVDGSDFFCALTFPAANAHCTFPAANAHCTFVVGGWGGGVVGISSLDGLDASENETTKYMQFDKERWYQIRARVTPEKITTWIDDDKLVDVSTKDRTVGMRIGEIELSCPLGIATYQTSAALRNIRLRKLEAERK